MNIKIPFRPNPIHNGKYATTTIMKNGKVVKEANIIYKALYIDRPRIIIYKDDIFD